MASANRHSKVKKVSLLKLLAKCYPEISRETLFSSILCGDIRVNGGIIRDSKELIPVDAHISMERKRYVSRGGGKLETAFNAWHFPVEGKVFIDAGSSTGGFTDFLLQHGAAGVHCVDVGYNQLDYSLRNNPKVYVHERTNILSFINPNPEADAAVGDLSFRSLSGAVHHVLLQTREKWGIFLLKPQFEIQNPGKDFDGVLYDKNEVRTVVQETLVSLADEGIQVIAVVPSAVQGTRGNQEYLCHLCLDASADSESCREAIHHITASL